MKIRDAILLVEQGMGSVAAASTDKWGVAYHQVADGHHSDRKIVVVAGVGRGRTSRSLVPLSDSVAFGASMPCAVKTDILSVFVLF